MYLADNITSHPKILRAAELLGDPTPERVIALYVASIGYARHHLTDGLVSQSWLASNPCCTRVSEVVKIFADRRVRLFHRRARGFLIHDFEQWNGKAREIKAKRAKERQRVADWRARQSRGVR